MSPKLIYLLEDDTDILQLLPILLSKSGYTVMGFSSVKSFGAQIFLHSPDLCILDINLPDGNGLDVCLELSKSKTTAAIPILLMSANGYYEQQYLQAGARGFIAKPFQIADLIDAVKKLI